MEEKDDPEFEAWLDKGEWEGFLSDRLKYELRYFQYGRMEDLARLREYE